jgi:hypothetical protein
MKILLFRTWIKLVNFLKILCLIYWFWLWKLWLVILALNIIGNEEVFDNGGHSPLCDEYVTATAFRNLCMILSIGKCNTKRVLLDYFDRAFLLLLLQQALQIHCLKVLAFSDTSSHLNWSGMHFVKLFIFIILKSFLINFPF